MGVKITAVPVGQGTMNIVHEYDGAGRLIYLALLDCGGDSPRKRPSDAKLFHTLRELMHARAGVKYPGGSFYYYIDDLIISHRDSDHINFLTTNYLFKDVYIKPQNAPVKGGVARRGVTSMGRLKRIPKASSGLFKDGDDDDDDDDDTKMFFRHTDGYYNADPLGLGISPKICDTYEAVRNDETDSDSIDCMFRCFVTHTFETQAARLVPFSSSNDVKLVSEVSFSSRYTNTGLYAMKFDGACVALSGGAVYDVHMVTVIEVYNIFAGDKKYTVDAKIVYETDVYGTVMYYMLLCFTTNGTLLYWCRYPIAAQPGNVLTALTLLEEAMAVCIEKFIPDIVEKKAFDYLKQMQVFYSQINEHNKKAKYNYVYKTTDALIAELYPPSIKALPMADDKKKLEIGKIYLGGMAKGQTTLSTNVQKTLGKLLPDGCEIETIADGLTSKKISQLSVYMIGTPQKCYMKNSVFAYQNNAFGTLDTLTADQNGCSIITIYYRDGEVLKSVLPGDATTLTALHFNFKIKKEFKNKKYEKMDTAPSSLMAPHHGSCTSMDMDVFEAFLKNINAKRIAISAGIKNRHGLPNNSFMLRCNHCLTDTNAGDHYLYYNTTDYKKLANWEDKGKTKKHLYTLFHKVSAAKDIGAYELTYEGLMVTKKLLGITPFVDAPTVGTTVRTEPNESAQQNILRLRNTFDFVYER